MYPNDHFILVVQRDREREIMEAVAASRIAQAQRRARRAERARLREIARATAGPARRTGMSALLRGVWTALFGRRRRRLARRRRLGACEG
ncbi:MAG: hypothetical protein ACLFUA_08025 [Spirochaetales bacterium]